MDINAAAKRMAKDLKQRKMDKLKILKQYSKDSGTIVRSTSDLSPLEEWLIMKLESRVPGEEEIIKQLKGLLNLQTFHKRPIQTLDIEEIISNYEKQKT